MQVFPAPPFKLLDQTHRPWGPTLETIQKPWQECLDILPHLLRVLLIEKSILPGIMVVDKFLFCLLWRTVHKSYTLNFCLEEWFINLLIHAYQYRILLRLFHQFSFHSFCSYWILVYFRFVLHFSIFRCVIFRFVSFRFVRCVLISFRSLVQPFLYIFQDFVR